MSLDGLGILVTTLKKESVPWVSFPRFPSLPLELKIVPGKTPKDIGIRGDYSVNGGGENLQYTLSTVQCELILFDQHFQYGCR